MVSFWRGRYRWIVKSGENHGSREWGRRIVRQQIVLLAVQIFAFIAGVDRVYLSIARPHFYVTTFLFAGFLRTGMAVGIAWCVWSDYRAYQKL